MEDSDNTFLCINLSFHAINISYLNFSKPLKLSILTILLILFKALFEFISFKKSTSSFENSSILLGLLKLLFFVDFLKRLICQK